MPAHNTQTQEKKSKGPKGKAGGKGLSKKDRQAEENNWDNIDEYLSLTKQRIVVDGLSVARVTRIVGASRCEVQHMNGIVEIFPIAGSVKLNSGHKHHVQACVSSGSMVLINGGQITGTFLPGQLVRAERYLHTIQLMGLVDPSKPSPAGGGPVRIPAEFLSRVITEGRITVPANFFGTAAPEEQGNYVFDYGDEKAPPKVKDKNDKNDKNDKVLDDEDDGAEVEVNLDDL